MDRQAFIKAAKEEVKKYNFVSLDDLPVNVEYISLVSHEEELDKIIFTGFLRADFEDGKQRNILCNDIPILKVDDKVLTGEDVHRLIFKYDDNQVCWSFRGYSLKTKAYLDKVRKEIGLGMICLHFDDEGVPLENEKRLSEFYSEVVVTGKNNGRYILKVFKPGNFETVNTYEFYFDSEITREKILTATAIVNVIKLINKRNSEVVRCWECGRVYHWTDIFAEDFATKVDNFEDNFCGNCDVPVGYGGDTLDDWYLED